MWALIGVKVELFLGDLLPGVFDPAPLGLLQVFLSQVELGAFVFRCQKAIVPYAHKTVRQHMISKPPEKLHTA